jgi:hypothetical protein
MCISYKLQGLVNLNEEGQPLKEARMSGKNFTNYYLNKVVEENENKPISYVEIGVQYGPTVRERLKLLPPGSDIYLFDFEPVIEWNKKILMQHEDYNFHFFGVPTEGTFTPERHPWYLESNGYPVTVGDRDFCAKEMCDLTLKAAQKASYVWDLSKLANQEDMPKFDYVLLDGAHCFQVDAAALWYLEYMMKPDTILELDDWGWTPSGSPTCGYIRHLFTEPQWYAFPINIIIEMLERSDKYETLVEHRFFKVKK